MSEEFEQEVREMFADWAPQDVHDKLIEVTLTLRDMGAIYVTALGSVIGGIKAEYPDFESIPPKIMAGMQQAVESLFDTQLTMMSADIIMSMASAKAAEYRAEGNETVQFIHNVRSFLAKEGTPTSLEDVLHMAEKFDNENYDYHTPA